MGFITNFAPTKRKNNMKDKKAISIKTLNKSNVWEIQENDVIRMWEAAEKDADFKEKLRHFKDTIKTAFEIEDVKIDKPVVIDKLEQRGFKIGTISLDEKTSHKIAIKKRAIKRVTDLTYENVGHISATKLVEVLERNFGSGWESLPQSIQDIIESAFDISTTTLPADRLHKAGGLYDKKVNDGYEVLEIAKGSWTEAIFIKEKPKEELTAELEEPSLLKGDDFDSDEDGDEDLRDDLHDDDDEDDDTFDDDRLTEESYRTTYETNPDDLNYEAEEISDDSASF